MFIDLEKHTVITPELHLPGDEPLVSTKSLTSDIGFVRLLFAFVLIVIVGFFTLM